MAHDPAHDPYTGKPRRGLAGLYGSMSVPDKLRYCERLFDEGHEARIESHKLALETMDKSDYRYANWLHYVTVMPDVLAWTRAEYSRLLALRQTKPKRR